VNIEAFSQGTSSHTVNKKRKCVPASGKAGNHFFIGTYYKSAPAWASKEYLI